MALGLFLFFAASAVDSATVTAAADAAAADAAAATAAANVSADVAPEAALQYLQGAGIRTRDTATADRCATTEIHSPFLTGYSVQTFQNLQSGPVFSKLSLFLFLRREI